MPGPLFIDPSALDLDRAIMNRAQIAEILPHRDQMAFLESVLICDLKGGLCVGTMTVPQTAFWTSGHFPGNPILPGVVLIEASAQLACLYYKLGLPEVRHRLVLFGGVEDVRFRGTVRPGDRVVLAAKLITATPRGGKNAVQAYLNNKLIYEGLVLAVTAP